MTKIIFITSGKINYEFIDKTLFQSIRTTASGKKFPHIVKEAEREVFEKGMHLQKKKISVIFSAPSNQCIDTAKILSGSLKVPVLKREYLLPLKFELTHFFSEEEFNSYKDDKFIKLRQMFVDNFVADKILDPASNVRNSFNKLSRDVGRYKCVLVVSHAYIIKLFSIYYEIGDRMYKDKNILVKMFNPNEEPMKRLETLEIKI